MEPYRILHEDEDILIADKLAPIPVQPEKTGDPSLQDLLRAELAARPGGGQGAFLEAAHRIDRRASGAVIFAKTHRALETLEADFRSAISTSTTSPVSSMNPSPMRGGSSTASSGTRGPMWSRPSS